MKKSIKSILAVLKPYKGFIFLLLFIAIPLSAIGIDRLAEYTINTYNMNGLSSRILAANTNENIAYIKEAYYIIDSECYFNLLVETKLNKSEVTDYFDKINIVPLSSNKKAEIEIWGPVKAIDFENSPLMDLAKTIGKIKKFRNPSGDEDYFIIRVSEK